MAEHEANYHPAVEEVMETSGPDAGRVKAIEIAETVAHEDNQRRDWSPGQAEVLENATEYRVKGEIATQAAQSAAGPELSAATAQNVAEDAIRGHIGSFDQSNPDIIEAKHAARRAAASYDELQRNLAEARQTISEQDDGVVA